MKLKVIGVDNGYGLTKTAHYDFVTSLKKYGTARPPLMERIIQYEGNYYGIGGDRLKVKPDKTVDNQTYIVTLAGIAEELRRDGLHEAEIVLAVGLPIERCGVGKDAFIQYFKQHEELTFSYEEQEYHIIIREVLVFPQGYAALIDDINAQKVPDNTVLVDIGSWTMDILPITRQKADISHCLSLNDGVITCMLSVNEEIRRNFGSEIYESQIQDVMMGKKDVLPPKYMELITKKIREYVENIASSLREHKFNTETLSFIFVGGGACCIKNYGMDLFASARVITDIHINAIGYERIAKGIYKDAL